MTEVVIYEGQGGTVEVRLDRETVWLAQSQMGELFDTSTDNIGLHLKNIFTEELGLVNEIRGRVDASGGKPITWA